MNLFYAPHIDTKTQQHVLSEQESKHICKVLRMQVGNLIGLLNGKGLLATTQITDANPKKCILNILDFQQEEASKQHIHIAICPTKMNDRLEWFVEKATEIGVTEISFILSKNSERTKIKFERFQNIAISAMKQSQRLYLPVLHQLMSVKEFIQKHDNGFIAHCYPSVEKLNLLNVYDFKSPILIGPEGDFTQEECVLAEQKSYTFIDLGKNRLRTETAGLVACMQAVNKLNF